MSPGKALAGLALSLVASLAMAWAYTILWSIGLESLAGFDVTLLEAWCAASIASLVIHREDRPDDDDLESGSIVALLLARQLRVTPTAGPKARPTPSGTASSATQLPSLSCPG